jgi:5'(3')-deoxyribonucleotidase
MIWFIDLDSTLNNLLQTWAHYHNRMCMICKEPFDWRKVNKWEVHEFVACGTNIYTYLDMPEVYLDATVEPYALDAITYLLKRHKVYVVTDCYSVNAITAKYQWMATYFPPVPIITMADKHLLRGDVMIDDKAEHLLYANTKHRVCYDRLWNRDIKLVNRSGKYRGIVKMFCWNEIYDLEARFMG